MPRERIELSASPLPRVRSTTELPRHIGPRLKCVGREGARYWQKRCKSQLQVDFDRSFSPYLNEMTDKTETPTREERLAARLRENLRRRKAQGRELRESGDSDLSKPDASG